MTGGKGTRKQKQRKEKHRKEKQKGRQKGREEEAGGDTGIEALAAKNENAEPGIGAGVEIPASTDEEEEAGVEIPASRNEEEEEEAESEAEAEVPAATNNEHCGFSLKLPSSNIIVKGISTQSSNIEKDIRLAFKHFNLLKGFECYYYAREDHFWTIFQLRRNDLPKFTLLVTDSNSNQSSLPPPKGPYILPELDSFEVDDPCGTKRRIILYPAFDTLDTHLSRLPNPQKLNLEHFRPIFKHYTKGACALFKMGSHPQKLSCLTLVVLEDNTGSLLCPLGCESFNAYGDFRAMELAIRGAFKGENFKYLPARMHTFLKQLGSTSTPVHVQWLPYAPFLLVPYKKVHTFIERIKDLASYNDQVREIMWEKPLQWLRFVAAEGNREMEEVSKFERETEEVIKFEGPRGEPAWKDWKQNYFHFLIFLRNCVHHLNEHKFKQNEHQFQPRKQSKEAKSTGRSHDEFSEMLVDPKRFLQFIDKVDAGFLDFIYDTIRTSSAPCLFEPSGPSSSTDQSQARVPDLKPITEAMIGEQRSSEYPALSTASQASQVQVQKSSNSWASLLFTPPTTPVSKGSSLPSSSASVVANHPRPPPEYQISYEEESAVLHLLGRIVTDERISSLPEEERRLVNKVLQGKLSSSRT